MLSDQFTKLCPNKTGLYLCQLHDLRLRRRWELCAEDPIPETARDTEAVLVVHEMVLKMVLLELAVVRGEANVESQR